MKRSIMFLALIVCAGALLMTGCTSLRSALVTGDNQVVLAVNLETDALIGAATLPDAAGIPTGLITPVVTLNGTVAYLTGGDDRTYVLNIDDAALTLNPAPPVSIPDDGVVLSSAAANPWMLVRGNPAAPGFALSANNTLDLTIAVSSVPFTGIFEQAIVCDDGRTVLTRESAERRIRMFNLDRSGLLTDTGHALPLGSMPTWVACAPGASAGAVMLPVGADASVVSFRIDAATGLTAEDSVTSHAVVSGAPGPINNAVAFSADASGLFLRSSSIIGSDQDGWIERFTFDPATAMIGDIAEFSVRAGVSYVAGRQQIGVDSDGEKIYLPNAFVAGGRIDIVDANDGTGLGTLTHPDMPNPVEFVVAR
jgi:hypothetical protein